MKTMQHQARHLAVLLGVAAALAIAGCTKNSAAFLPAPPAGGKPTAAPAHTLYVADEGSATYISSFIYLYDPTQLSGGSPYGYIGGYATHLNGPWAVTTDSAGNIWVANADGLSSGNGASVTEYKAGAQGDAPAITYLLGNKTGLTSPVGVAVDGAGIIYVADWGNAAFNIPGNGTVRIFAKGSNGNVAPIAVIGGSNTGLNTPYDLKLDSAGNVWVADRGANQIDEWFKGHVGNVPPDNVLTGDGFTPRGISFDASGNLWVATDGGIEEYAGPQPSGAQAPMVANGGNLCGARGIVNDGAGSVFVSDICNGIVTIFPPGDSSGPFTASFGPEHTPRHMWIH